MLHRELPITDNGPAHRHSLNWLWVVCWWRERESAACGGDQLLSNSLLAGLAGLAVAPVEDNEKLWSVGDLQVALIHSNTLTACSRHRCVSCDWWSSPMSSPEAERSWEERVIAGMGSYR